MALTSQHLKQLDIPHEEGQWVKVRMPSLRMLHEMSKHEDTYDGMVKMIAGCVAEWSYDAPVTEEAVWDLDAETAGFIGKALNPNRTEDEEKNS